MGFDRDEQKQQTSFCGEQKRNFILNPLQHQRRTLELLFFKRTWKLVYKIMTHCSGGGGCHSLFSIVVILCFLSS